MDIQQVLVDLVAGRGTELVLAPHHTTLTFPGPLEAYLLNIHTHNAREARTQNHECTNAQDTCTSVPAH